MLQDQIAGLLVIRLTLVWESADDVCGNDHVWNLLLQEVANLIELLDSVLSIHFIEDIVGARLDRNVQELVNSGMIQYIRHGLQMLQNERRVCHSEAKHDMIWHNLDNAL